MPLPNRRFAPTGPRDPRETATLCNQISEAAGIQIDALAERVTLLEQIIVETRVAFQGAMSRETDDPGPDITGTYQTIDDFSAETITAQGCTLTIATGEFSFDRIGAWELVLSFNISHDESNAGRETNIRLFNVTEATAANPAPIAIGRNQPGTNFYGSLAFTLATGDIGDTYRIEIGGGDTLATVVWNSKQIVLRYLDAVGSLVDPTP